MYDLANNCDKYKKKISKLSNYFSILVALLPILATYASGIPGFSFADICLFLFFCLSFLFKGSLNNYKVSINSLILGLFLIAFFSFISCIKGFPLSNIDVIIRTIRYVFYILVLLTAGKKFLNISILIEFVKRIAILGSFFIIFQTLMYYSFGIVIKGFFSFFPLYVEHYSEYDYASAYKILNMYRPTSFFLEPAHYSRYCAIAIVLFLFCNKEIDKKSFFGSILCLIGVILSTSSQGYFLVGIIFVLFLFTRINKVKSRSLKSLLLFILILFPIFLFFLFKSPIIQATLTRTLSGSISNDKSALGARMGGFLSYLDLPLINMLIGTGFGNVPVDVWLSSAAYWLYGSGIIVFIVYLYFLLKSFFKLDTIGRYILFIIFFLFFTDDSFYSYMIVLFFSFILFCPKKGNEKI